MLPTRKSSFGDQEGSVMLVRSGAAKAHAVLVAAAAASASAPLLPFARSGARVRSGYELVRTAASAGVLTGSVGRLATVALAVLPLVAAGALASFAFRSSAALVACTALAGAVAAAVGLAVVRARVESEVGAWVAMTAGALAIGSSVVVAKR
jgi:hypothetical protein